MTQNVVGCLFFFGGHYLYDCSISCVMNRMSVHISDMLPPLIVRIIVSMSCTI